MCCITHRALFLSEPFYLIDEWALSTLLTNWLYTHSLCSISFNPLLIYYFNTKSNGFRTFSYTALFLCYHLLRTVLSAPTNKSFRRNFKTYLLNQAFPTRIVFPIRNHLWLLTVLCTLAVLSGQVAFEPQFTGEVNNL